MNLILKQARRLMIAVVGGTVTLVGVVMIVTPGPAIVVIPLGLAILATEFVWARVLLMRFKHQAITLADSAKKELSKRREKTEAGAGEDAVAASSSHEEK